MAWYFLKIWYLLNTVTNKYSRLQMKSEEVLGWDDFYRFYKAHHHIGSKCLYLYRNIDQYGVIIVIFTIPSHFFIP